uniref:Venom allergen/ancylostoma secreted protein-like 2 isoform 3 n=1 Tax=Heligmosomoides polygyrus bakeri TaxID=375939 RepID=G4XWW9_HELBE|nr:venom allergen/ancylostoma secreted protein-like 2 isoform 3 [Heligmosomoides bakeri]
MKIIILFLVAGLIHRGNAQAAPTCADIAGKLNDVRSNVARAQPGFGVSVGSQQMFSLECDPMLQQAATVLVSICRDAGLPLIAGSSFNMYQALQSQPPLQATQVVDAAISDWRTKAAFNPLPADAIYSNQNLESFANMIYYKSTKVGCAYQSCNALPPYPAAQSVVCVFDNKPALNSQLYPPGTGTTGCTDPDCANALTGATCQTAAGNTQGLCSPQAGAAFPTDTTPAATTTAAATTAATTTAATTAGPTTADTTTAAATTTTAAPTTTESGLMTQTIRDRVLEIHNNRRQLLATGQVVNGRTGQNCGTGMNIYQMKYDRGLEVLAQNYADQCPTNANGSAVATRPDNGENVKIIPSNTVPFYDAVLSASQSWWDEIAINGVNHQMRFTDFLQTKPLAPIRWTQMAWATTYRLGCGVQRCGGNTVVVCRYAPRGNIVDQYIYKVGAPCGDCMSSCISGSLCTPPLRSLS